MKTLSTCDVGDLERAAELVNSLKWFDLELSLALVEVLVPVVSEALSKDPVNGFRAAMDLFWWILGYAPDFLRGGREPDARCQRIASDILMGVGKEPFVMAVMGAKRRDWSTLKSVSALIREAAPELATSIAGTLSVSDIVKSVRHIADNSISEFDDILVSLLFSADHQRAAAVADAVCRPLNSMTWRAALIAPEVATAILRKGGEVKLALGGGLPNWEAAAGILASISQIDIEMGRKLLRASLRDLADGFLYRQNNGGDGALEFLSTRFRKYNHV